MAKITIILPVHNGANYLRSSIDSILAQGFEDFELHILDDGSTDESSAIALSYKDARVRYSRNAAKFGLFKTLNRGFAESQTELVRIWAHDDLMLPDSLAVFVEFAEQHPASGMVYCDFYAINPEGMRTGKETLYQTQRARTPEEADAPRSALLFFCFGCLPGNISTVMLHRKAWEKSGGFIEGKQQAPDYDMWVRVSKLFKVGFINRKIIELRDHPLQLGKLGQKQMTTIAEELTVLKQLLVRLEDSMSIKEAMKYWRQHRGRQHSHWVMKAIYKGEFMSAWRGLCSLKHYGSILPQFGWWALSVNGRYFTRSSADFFDSKSPPPIAYIPTSDRSSG